MVSLFKKRILAYIVDYFVVSAIMWIIAQVLDFLFHSSAFFVYDYFIFLLPIVIMIYFVVFEKNKGATVGKNLLNLNVLSTANVTYYSNISYRQAIERNLSKIYWFPIIIDLIIGLIVGSSNERILGKLSRTEVVEEGSDLDKIVNYNKK